MQDGAPIGEDPAAWLRTHFKDNPEPEISIRWADDARPDAGAYTRLLEILFSPSPDTSAP
ncbi:hypothetical protein [Streptomyces tsukubensis]|uniref:hypothetical protein n=1 Tax=Streptomyces tsukubensis TaxID=83656 RepID=UPI00344DD8A1